MASSKVVIEFYLDNVEYARTQIENPEAITLDIALAAMVEQVGKDLAKAALEGKAILATMAGTALTGSWKDNTDRRLWKASFVPADYNEDITPDETPTHKLF